MWSNPAPEDGDNVYEKLERPLETPVENRVEALPPL